MEKTILTHREVSARLAAAEPEIRALGVTRLALFGSGVELVTTEALSPFLAPRILAEAQDVLRAA